MSLVSSTLSRGSRQIGRLLLVSALFFGAMNVRAASDTWTNAPVDNNWANTNNWISKVAPGALNQTGNSVNNDVATFNSPISAGIGGATLPIKPDDATINGDRSRALGSIIFDTANCGAYVFQSTSPAVLPTASNPETGILNLCHNGSITLNATVTNSQTFLIPIRIRLPSSTWGAYNFVNNATDPSVVLYIDTVTNDSAATRSTTFYLGGSNTGTNTINSLSKGTTTSATALEGIVKQGTGTWILPGSNDFSGSDITIAINGGVLVIKDPGAFGTASTATINSNGTLEVDGITPGQSTINLQGQGTLRMNGTAAVNGIAVGTATGIGASLATTGSGDVMTVLTNSGGTVDSVLHVTGPGTVVLGGQGSYAGNWSFDSGICQVTNSLALGTGPQATVSAGGTLDLTPLGPITYTWTLGGLGGSGTGTAVGSTAATIKADPGAVISVVGANIPLTITPTSSSGDTTHPALYVSQGTLSMGNNVFSINNASGSPLNVGTYTLISQASGSITSAGGYSVAEVTGSGLAANTIGVIQVSGGSVNLLVESYTAKNLIWQGGSPNQWDNGTTPDWLNGASPSVFTTSDNVLFNSTGAANPNVALVGVLSPGSITVDTSAGGYTFSGSGKIGGATGLTKIGSGTLVVQTTNLYAGNTVISNGVLQLGGSDVIPGSASSGQVFVQSPGKLDLNGFNNTIGSLDGNGTVDSVSGGTVTLTVGNNNTDGSFSGVIQNTAGTVGLTKVGTGTETISGANNYTGPTVINAGTLAVGNINALGSSTLTLNVGALDLGSSLTVSNATSGFGTSIAANSSSTPVTLYSHGTGTLSSLISDGSGGGAISIVVADGGLTLNGPNTYSGITYVAAGAALGLGVNNTAGTEGEAGAGGIIASNGATVSMPTSVHTSEHPAANITTVNGATVTFTSGSTANGWAGQFIGSSTATNIFANGNQTIEGVMSFSNFLGTVLITNGEVRIYRNSTPIDAGGDNTSFIFENGGGMFTRENENVHLGSLSGNGVITAPAGGGTLLGNYIIGAKNLDSEFSGGISGSNDIVKVGSGILTLDGGGQYTTNVTQNGLFFVTNIGYGTNMLLYIGSTTVSNGVLKLAVPSLLTNSTPVTVASATAVLDASDMGYISNFITTDGNGNTITNQYPVTNGVFEVVSGQTLQGIGTLNGTLLADPGSTFNVGLPLGNFSVTGNAHLSGTVTMGVNGASTPNSSELFAPSFVIDGTATLVVTNLGPEVGATFQLFNHAVIFNSVILPPLTGTNSWVNNLSVNGSIKLVAPSVSQITPVITHLGVSGTTLNITATNGADNGTFVLLQSTNVAAPLPSWTPVLTNTFDANGNLTLSTNVVNTAIPQEFYILSQ